MDLGKRNQEYWNQYEAGSTPGIDEVPDKELLMGLPEDASVLDIGTGTGKLAELLTSLSFRVSAIDINEHEIDANTKRGSDVDYSVQDITGTTAFPDASFDLLALRYVLTNIHKDQWQAFSTEVDRITKPGGIVWLAEPQVNAEHEARYKLASEILDDEHALYVFKDRSLAPQVQNKAELDKVIASDGIARIVRHYTKDELIALFPNFEKTNEKHVRLTSPSGYPLDTAVLTLRKL